MNAQNNTMAELIAAPPSEGIHTSSPSLRFRRLRINGLRLLVLALIFGGWELTTRLGIVDPFFWGQPSGIVAQIITWVTQGTAQGPLWEQIITTLEEAVIGFVIGAVLGVLFGVVLGRNQFLSDVLGPFIKAANAIPRIVLGSIFVIALGYDIQSKVALAMVMVFFIVFFNAFQGVREVDRSLLANARILGASQRRLSTAVILPSVLSWIIASLHTSFSFALVGAVVGEYLGATAGLGLMVQNAQGIFNSNGVFAVMAILTAVALSAEALITALEHRLIRWRPATVNDVPL